MTELEKRKIRVKSTDESEFKWKGVILSIKPSDMYRVGDMGLPTHMASNEATILTDDNKIITRPDYEYEYDNVVKLRLA
jgi:hypothetical protein